MQIAAKHTYDTAPVSVARQGTPDSGFAMDAKRLVGLSHFWLGIGPPQREHHIKELDAIVLHAALAFEMTIRWKDWTIRATPPRHVLGSDGEAFWVPSIWVSSPRGVSTFVWNNYACIESVCRYILKKELASTELALACDSDDEVDF